MTLGAAAYPVGGETPSVQLRQKTYAINIMSATAVSCLVLQVMPYMINSDELNMGGKSKLTLSLPIYLLCLIWLLTDDIKSVSYSLPSPSPCVSTYTSVFRK